MEKLKSLTTCIVTYSASPIEVMNCAITSIKNSQLIFPNIEIKNDANYGGNLKRSREICRKFALFQTNNQIDEVYIPHIGQGLQARIVMKNGEYVCFDIGYSRCGPSDASIDQSIIVNDYSSLRHVILSHWDTDHILGAFHSISTQPLDVPWFASPMIKSQNAKRLAKTIHLKNDTNLLLFDHAPPLNFQSAFQIFKMHGSTSNDSGIGIIVDAGRKILIIGDAGYRYLPQLARNGIDVLVVSHHGAEVNGSPPAPRAQNDGIAVVTTGKNIYGHPRDLALQAVMNAGYNLHRTDRDGGFRMKF